MQTYFLYIRRSQVFLFGVLVLMQSSLLGCTAFQIRSLDGSQIYARSLEFGFPLDSQFLIVGKETEYLGTAPQGTVGLKWKVKYGYVGMNQAIYPKIVSDGMNEKGLTVGSLYMPGYAQYEPPNPNRQSETIAAWELPSLLLSLCATIDDVKELLPQILVTQQPFPSTSYVIPLHWHISDRSGACLIVEYVKGQRRIYDNPVGVLTNSPEFDWHLTNLSNYVNLNYFNISDLKIGEWTVHNFSQGSGMLGLPGDWTAPSRFVRAVFLSHWTIPSKTAQEAVVNAFHILNTFDIVPGIIQSRQNPAHFLSKTKIKELPESTEWVIVHDKTNLKTYFRTYESLCIEMVDLKKIDFSKPGFKQIPLENKFFVRDVTLQAKQMVEKKSTNR